MSDSPHDQDEGTVHLRRRTDGERLEWLLTEVALLMSNVGQLQRQVEGLKVRVKDLEDQ